MTNRRFGRLIAIERIGERKRGKNPRWFCKCDCGNLTIATSNNLRYGNTKSCGCLRKEISCKNGIRTHQKSKTRLYRIWVDMRRRCENNNRKAYKNYGGAGIKVCDEWKEKFESFYDWAMANGYSDDLSIDRINVFGDYEPDNCRWANFKTQANNKKNNHIIEFNNETHTLSEWGEITGINVSTINKRLTIYKWDIEKALTIKDGRRGK